MKNNINISLTGIPIYHIDSTELIDKLGCKDRRTRIERLENLGVNILTVGKNKKVRVLDLMEAFINLTDNVEDRSNYVPVSKSAKSFDDI